ncbi:MAG: hypothetical protein RI956_167 [Pseudomonadota bacterium]|jgi:hypothetical protein
MNQIKLFPRRHYIKTVMTCLLLSNFIVSASGCSIINTALILKNTVNDKNPTG